MRLRAVDDDAGEMTSADGYAVLGDAPSAGVQSMRRSGLGIVHPRWGSSTRSAM